MKKFNKISALALTIMLCFFMAPTHAEESGQAAINALEKHYALHSRASTTIDTLVGEATKDNIKTPDGKILCDEEGVECSFIPRPISAGIQCLGTPNGNGRVENGGWIRTNPEEEEIKNLGYKIDESTESIKNTKSIQSAKSAKSIQTTEDHEYSDCFSHLEICYGQNYQGTELEGKLGQECFTYGDPNSINPPTNTEIPVEFIPLGSNSSEFSQCDGSSTDDTYKEYCMWANDTNAAQPVLTESTYQRNSGIKVAISGDTGDDMFKIIPDADSGFIEYKDLGEQHRHGLKFIQPNNAKLKQAMMLPAGPKPKSGKTYDELFDNNELLTDYVNFMDNPPTNLITVENACHPAKAQLSCTDITPPSFQGVCGAAVFKNDGYYSSKNSIDPKDLCHIGSVTESGITETETEITWTCNGIYGGDISPQCTHKKEPIDAQCGSAHLTQHLDLEELTQTGELCKPGSTITSNGILSANKLNAGPWQWTCKADSPNATIKTASCTGLPKGLNCERFFENDNLVFVQDLSGSFQDDIANTSAALNSLFNNEVFNSWEVGLTSTKGSDGSNNVYQKRLGWTSILTDKDKIINKINSYARMIDGSEDPLYGIHKAIKDFFPRNDNESGTIVMITDEKDGNRAYLIPTIVEQLREHDLRLVILATADVTNYYNRIINNNKIADIASVQTISSNSENLSASLLKGLLEVGCDQRPVCGKLSGEEYSNFLTYSDIPEDRFCTVGDAVLKTNNDQTITWECEYKDAENQSCGYRIKQPECGLLDGPEDLEYTMHEEIPSYKFCAEGEAVLKTNNDRTIEWNCRLEGREDKTCSYDIGFDPVCAELSAANGDMFFVHDQINNDQFCEEGTVGSRSTANGTINWECRTGSDNIKNCSYEIPTGGICGGFESGSFKEPCTDDVREAYEEAGIYLNENAQCNGNIVPEVLESIAKESDDSEIYCNIGSLQNGAATFGIRTQSDNATDIGLEHRFRLAQWKCVEPGILDNKGNPFGHSCSFDTTQYLAQCSYDNAKAPYGDINNAKCELGEIRNFQAEGKSVRWECHDQDTGFYQNCGFGVEYTLGSSDDGMCNIDLRIRLDQFAERTANDGLEYCSQGEVVNFTATEDKINYECSAGDKPAQCSFVAVMPNGQCNMSLNSTLSSDIFASVGKNDRDFCSNGDIKNFSNDGQRINYECEGDTGGPVSCSYYFAD